MELTVFISIVSSLLQLAFCTKSNDYMIRPSAQFQSRISSAKIAEPVFQSQHINNLPGTNTENTSLKAGNKYLPSGSYSIGGTQNIPGITWKDVDHGMRSFQSSPNILNPFAQYTTTTVANPHQSMSGKYNIYQQIPTDPIYNYKNILTEWKDPLDSGDYYYYYDYGDTDNYDYNRNIERQSSGSQSSYTSYDKQSLLPEVPSIPKDSLVVNDISNRPMITDLGVIEHDSSSEDDSSYNQVINNVDMMTYGAQPHVPHVDMMTYGAQPHVPHVDMMTYGAKPPAPPASYGHMEPLLEEMTSEMVNEPMIDIHSKIKKLITPAGAMTFTVHFKTVIPYGTLFDKTDWSWIGDYRFSLTIKLPNFHANLRRQERSIVDYDRSLLYNLLSDFITNLGYDGESCLLRAVCEAGEDPPDEYGILGEMFSVVLAPGFSSGNITDDFTAAEQYGLSEGGCLDKYKDCSMSLRDLLHSGISTTGAAGGLQSEY